MILVYARMPGPKSDRSCVRFASKFIKVKQSYLCEPEGKLFFTVFTLHDPVWAL